MSIVEIAKAFATKKHENQKRWGGEPYIIHPAAVALAVAHLGEEFEVAAWLHDVIEDCGVTQGDLYDLGMSKMVVQAVDLLSKREDESYLAYLLSLKLDDIARMVKIADINHNLADSATMKNKTNIHGKWELALYILEH